MRELPSELADRGTTAVLEYIRNLTVPRGPVDVYLSDRHIAFDIDHGLGDARLYIDCVTTLFELIRGPGSSWLRDRDTPIPVIHALAHTFANPSRLRSAWTEARQRATPVRNRSAAGAPAAPPPSAAVQVIHVDAATEREVDDWRAADGAGVSRAVAWLVIVRTALAQAGLDAPVGAIDAAVKARLDAALPLLALTSTSARNLAAPLSATRAERAPADTPVELAYSDVGRLSPFEHLPWLPDRPRSINAALQPWAPADISVFSGTIGRERSITVSYHDDVHDSRLLQEAAEVIRTDPIRLLR